MLELFPFWPQGAQNSHEPARVSLYVFIAVETMNEGVNLSLLILDIKFPY